MVNEGHPRDSRTGRFIQRAQGRVVQMTEREDLRERVARLEIQMQHVSQKVDAIQPKMDVVHDILTQARGVRWFVITLVGVAAFFAGKLGAIAPGLFK